LQFGLHGFDGVAQLEQIAQAFTLLQAKLREASSRIAQRCEKCIACASTRVGQRKRHPVDLRAGGYLIDAAAEPLADEWLGHGAVRRAK